jgi:hypothetical protein
MQTSAILEKLRKCRLFQRPDDFHSASQLIIWWERRRIPYNLAVGTAGLITCGSLVSIAMWKATGTITKDADIGNPFFGIIVVILYAIMANVCYTAGWVAHFRNV